MIYAQPNAAGAPIQFKTQYDNFIGGTFVAPVKGTYFDVVTPITGKGFTPAARSTTNRPLVDDRSSRRPVFAPTDDISFVAGHRQRRGKPEPEQKQPDQE